MPERVAWVLAWSLIFVTVCVLLFGLFGQPFVDRYNAWAQERKDRKTLEAWKPPRNHDDTTGRAA